MDIRFNEKVCVVTGAGSGIGFACAETMAKSGAKVAMIGRDAGKIEKAAALLSSAGIVKPYALDVSKIADISSVIESIRADLGEIDYLIQSAGIMAGGDALQITEQQWDDMLATNAKGLFFVMQAVVAQSMKPRESGSIVNISSMAGIRGMTPPMCSAHYSASKGAVAALSMQGAVEWANLNIRVNAIAPGGVMGMGVGVQSGPKPGGDEIGSNDPGNPGGPGGPGGPGAPGGPAMDPIPTKRLSDPYEIAAAAAFLLSVWSANTTGQIIVIDGGSTAVGY